MIHSSFTSRQYNHSQLTEKDKGLLEVFFTNQTLTMKKLIIYSIVSLILTTGCGSGESAEYTADQMIASGEFLFEGPNTLQGAFLLSTTDISKELSEEASQLAGIVPSSVTVTLPNDSIRDEIESFLVQVVSDNLPLVTVGTISPLAGGLEQQLAINKELDLLPYAKDASSTLVVDTNLKSDQDDLSVMVDIKLNVNY